MPKVFIVEPPRRGLDIGQAAKFGEITYLFDGDRRFGVFNHVNYCRDVVTRLSAYDFDAANDYVCVVGSMIIVATALIAIAHTWDEFNVLLYNSINEVYVMRRFKKGDLQ